MVQKLIDDGVLSVTADGRYQLTREAWQAATIGGPYEERGLFHFVGFKDDRWWNAVRVWGRPDFVHRFWDVRAQHEVAPGDVVVFADGCEHDPPYKYAFDDSANF